MASVSKKKSSPEQEDYLNSILEKIGTTESNSRSSSSSSVREQAVMKKTHELYMQKLRKDKELRARQSYAKKLAKEVIQIHKKITQLEEELDSQREAYKLKSKLLKSEEKAALAELKKLKRQAEKELGHS